MKAWLSFFGSLLLLAAWTACDAWLSIRCVEAGGRYERGWLHDTCERVGK